MIGQRRLVPRCRTAAIPRSRALIAAAVVRWPIMVLSLVCETHAVKQLRAGRIYHEDTGWLRIHLLFPASHSDDPDDQCPLFAGIGHRGPGQSDNGPPLSQSLHIGWVRELVQPHRRAAFGRMRISARGVVRDSGIPDVVVPDAAQHAVENLPEE